MGSKIRNRADSPASAQYQRENRNNEQSKRNSGQDGDQGTAFNQDGQPENSADQNTNGNFNGEAHHFRHGFEDGGFSDGQQYDSQFGQDDSAGSQLDQGGSSDKQQFDTRTGGTNF
ncbi:hypothetical protein [Neobacillus terrae]|uniref:hypothetical protein n=1 Tax=Neobacillus terrae TaxID=3034837 RepID=UPI00140950B3|nr:hypothetical protein [Neobacillus terrae]NHM31183.1 hypothetical protein [Neobacillus terrae]